MSEDMVRGPAPSLPATLLTSNPAKWKASAISRSPLLPSSRKMATRGAGPPVGRRNISEPESYSAPQSPETFSRAGPGIQAQGAQEGKPLHILPHQVHGARMLWEKWGAGSSWALFAPSTPVPPLPHSSALPAAGPAGNSSPPRGLAAAQRAPPEPQLRSLIPGPRGGQIYQSLTARKPNRGPSEAGREEPHLSTTCCSLLFFISSPWHRAQPGL